MSPRVYSFLVILDFIIMGIIPLQMLINFTEQSSLEINSKISLNLFDYLENLSIFLYLTDAINIILLFNFNLLILGFWKQQKIRKDQIFSNKSFNSKVAMMLIFFGRFITQYFFGMQISAIKCYFDSSSCHQKTDNVRISTNTVGALGALILSFCEQRFFFCIFPDHQVPWARLKSKYEILSRFLTLLSILALVFEDVIIDKFNFYVILIPIAFISSLLLWYSFFTVKYFSKWVNKAFMIRDVIIWNMSVYGITIDLINHKSDYSYCILTVVSIGLMIITIWMKRETVLLKEFKIEKLSNKDIETQKVYLLLRLILLNEEDSELILKKIYQKHIRGCDNKKCYCKAQSIDDVISSHIDFEDLNRIRDDSQQINEQDNEQKDNNQQQLNDLDQGDNQEEKDEQTVKLLRDEILMRILITNLKKINNSLQIRFLDIFINVEYFKRLYSSFYRLLKLKGKCSTSNDKNTFYYLKNMIYRKVKEHERQIKKNLFDIDQSIDVEEEFQEYKKLVQETTIFVERFWRQLSKPDYNVGDLISIGQKIVDSYLQTKLTFDNILEKKPEFKEALVLHVQFNQDVMNFETESQNYQNMLKNLHQKLIITKQSSYMITNEQQGIILVSGDPEKRNKIILVNQILSDQAGYSSLHLVGKSLNYLLPRIIAQVHDQIIGKFLTLNHTRHQTSSLPRVWIKRSDQTIVPCRIEIQTCVSEQKGLILVGMVSFDIQVQSQNLNSSVKNAYFLLTDESGYIQNVSYNFKKRFLTKDAFAIEDSRISAEEMIRINESDKFNLKKGVQAQIIENYSVSESHQNMDSQDIMVIMNEFKLPKKIQFREYVFITVDVENPYQRQSLLKVTHGQVEQKQLDYFQNEMDQIAIELNLSSESGSSKSNVVLNFKGTIDYTQTPKSLSNLRKAIYIFFFILIATSFSVLGVTQIQNKQFVNDSKIVEHSIYLGGRLAYLRLAFRLLFNQLRVEKDQPKFEPGYLQAQMEKFFQLAQNDNFIVVDENNFSDQELADFMNGDNVMIQEMQSDGTIVFQNKKFSIAIQQYMTKLQKFITMDYDIFKRDLENY